MKLRPLLTLAMAAQVAVTAAALLASYAATGTGFGLAQVVVLLASGAVAVLLAQLCTRAIETALTALLARESLAPTAISYLGHGATVCVNAVLPGNVARTGLLTTRGMRDLRELRRQTRDLRYGLQAEKPAPLVPLKPTRSAVV